MSTVGVMSSSGVLHILISHTCSGFLLFIYFAGRFSLLQATLTDLTAGLHLVMALEHDTPRYGPALLLITIFVSFFCFCKKPI